MNLRVPRSGVVALILATVAAIALFVYLMGRFGGPSLRFSSPYAVTGSFPDTKGLARRSDVWDRGVKIGQVESISVTGGVARVRFSIAGRYAPLYRDAHLRIGEKTLLGESYIDVDRGHARAGALPRGTVLATSHTLAPAVEIDQALNALDRPSRVHVRGMLGTFAAGAAAPDASAQVNATVGRLAGVTGRLRRLADLLHGQEPEIASGVQDARTVLGELGRREQQVRAIVSGGRATLGALASRDAALRAGLAELPSLLGTADRTLRHMRPLLAHARPLLADLRVASPPLTAALRDLPPVAGDARTVLAGLPAFDRVVLPFLSRANAVLRLATPVAASLPPALRNTVSIARYLSDRKQAFAAWFSNTGDLGASGDAKASSRASSSSSSRGP